MSPHAIDVRLHADPSPVPKPPLLLRPGAACTRELAAAAAAHPGLGTGSNIYKIARELAP